MVSKPAAKVLNKRGGAGNISGLCVFIDLLIEPLQTLNYTMPVVFIDFKIAGSLGNGEVRDRKGTL
jgi:hypothetical protein